MSSYGHALIPFNRSGKSRGRLNGGQIIEQVEVRARGVRAQGQRIFLGDIGEGSPSEVSKDGRESVGVGRAHGGVGGGRGGMGVEGEGGGRGRSASVLGGRRRGIGMDGEGEGGGWKWFVVMLGGLMEKGLVCGRGRRRGNVGVDGEGKGGG